MNDAREPAPELGLHRHHEALSPNGDQRFLEQRTARLRVYNAFDGLHGAAIVGPALFAKLAEVRRGIIRQLATGGQVTSKLLLQAFQVGNVPCQRPEQRSPGIDARTQRFGLPDHS